MAITDILTIIKALVNDGAKLDKIREIIIDLKELISDVKDIIKG